MQTITLGRFNAFTRRLLLALAAIVLVAAPNVVMSANASILANDKFASTDPTMLMDETLDFGPVADPPPALVGAVNMLFIGVVPDETLRMATRQTAGRLTWALSFCAPLRSCIPDIPTRPPRI